MPATNVALCCTLAPTKSMKPYHTWARRLPPCAAGGPVRVVTSFSYDDVSAFQLMLMNDRDDRYWRPIKTKPSVNAAACREKDEG